mgnify:CR=1 FL=1
MSLGEVVEPIDRPLRRCLPTSSTTPATSSPKSGLDGVTRPVTRRSGHGVPVNMNQSAAFTDVAWTRTSTSSARRLGGGCSPVVRTSAPP